MTEAPHLSNQSDSPDWADRMEQAVLDAALRLDRPGLVVYQRALIRGPCPTETVRFA